MFFGFDVVLMLFLLYGHGRSESAIQVKSYELQYLDPIQRRTVELKQRKEYLSNKLSLYECRYKELSYIYYRNGQYAPIAKEMQQMKKKTYKYGIEFMDSVYDAEMYYSVYINYLIDITTSILICVTWTWMQFARRIQTK
jgi:hypothetical protein